MDRRDFLKGLADAALLFSAAPLYAKKSAKKNKPNIILMMCDDLGYGDTGFNNNKVIKTPNMDSLAEKGTIFTHFYSIGPVCSPTRGSCLTGRHYFRYGIFYANRGHLPQGEIVISEVLKSKGYRTGHFGKWHLGTLSKEFSAKGRKRQPEKNFSPPWEHSYDSSFVTESAVATWDPAGHKRYKNNPYWENGKIAEKNLKGCDSRIIMDRVIPFIENAAREDKPFLAVVWFHAPHKPVIAGPDYLKMYEDLDVKESHKHYYGCITAVDDQIKRLQKKLKELGLYDNSLQFFCSDNGPEGKDEAPGSTGGLKGRKRSLYDGGVRVPAFVVWPGIVPEGKHIDTPCSTLDYFPTISRIAGFKMKDNRPIDGEDIMPILQGKSRERRKAIPFRSTGRSFGSQPAAIIKGKWKLQTDFGHTPDMLFDIQKDDAEENNLASKHPGVVGKMKKQLKEYLDSFKASLEQNDYKFDPGEELGSPDMVWDMKPKKKKNKGHK